MKLKLLSAVLLALSATVAAQAGKTSWSVSVGVVAGEVHTPRPHRHPHRHHRHHGPPVVIYPGAPVYHVQPAPPVVIAHPPVVYLPAPVVVAPPPVLVSPPPIWCAPRVTFRAIW